MTRLGYRPQLDGIRGIAILGVLLVHVFHVPSGGGLGVDLFFVLSGFLITTLLLQEWQENGTISLTAFYRRRVLRLFPALLAMLAVVTVFVGACWIGGAMSGAGARWMVVGILSGGLYVQNLIRAVGGPDSIAPIVGHLWSLSAEEQFYIVWPGALVFALRRRFTPRAIVAIAAVAALVVMGRRVELTLTGASYPRIFFSPDTHSDPILLGCALGAAYVYGLVPNWKPRTWSIVGVAAFVTVIECMLFMPLDHNRFLFGLPLFEAASGALVLSVVMSEQAVMSRVLRGWGPKSLGRISYGLYVWHTIPVALAVAAGYQFAGVPLSIAVALLSYRYIEQPFLRRKRRPSLEPSRALVGAGAMPAGARAR